MNILAGDVDSDMDRFGNSYWVRLPTWIQHGGSKCTPEGEIDTRREIFLILSSLRISPSIEHLFSMYLLNYFFYKVIESWMNSTMQVSDEQLTVIWSATTSVMCIGGIIGGALTGVLSMKFGRRTALIMNNFIAIAAGLLSGDNQFLTLALLGLAVA